MMNIFSEYKSVWLFLAKFFGVYIAGVLIYNGYLSGYIDHLDSATTFVTEQVAKLLSLSLPQISTFYSCEAPFSEIHYFGVPVVTMIEGCNAISVMILFLAFIIAFTGKFKSYLWFGPLGLVMIYLSNIVRIYLIAMIVLYYPNYIYIAHDYLFPAIIYGTVFILWVFWVKFIVLATNEK